MTMNALRIERDRLALEAGLSPDLPTLLQKTLPSIVAGFAGLTNRLLPTDEGIPLPPREQDFLKSVLKHSYLNIAPLAAYVPEGLSVPYLKYLHALVPAVDYAAHSSPKHIGEFAMFLSQLVTSSEQKLSTLSFKRENEASQRLRDKLNADMGKCFRVGSTRAEVTIGDVVERNADWQDMLRMNNQQVKDINSVNRKELNQKLANCTELMNVLIAKIQRGEMAGVSPQVVANIADCAYNSAQEAEFFAAVYYKSMAFAEAVNQTMSHFHRVFHK